MTRNLSTLLLLALTAIAALLLAACQGGVASTGDCRQTGCPTGQTCPSGEIRGDPRRSGEIWPSGAAKPAQRLFESPLGIDGARAARVDAPEDLPDGW